jgi:steroid delta-isomerase
MPADAAAIRATIDRYTSCFSAADRDAFLANFADDAWIEDPVGTPRREGKASIGEFWDQTQGMADSVELRRTGPVRIAAGGGEAAFPMQARPLIGGATFCVHIIDVMTFDDEGRITTMRAFWDPAEMGPAED